jgi:hypothetical protein
MREIKAVIAAIAIVAFGAGNSFAAIGDAEKCLAAKIKIVGKYEACRFKAEALAVVKETAVDNAKCESKYTDSWAKAELKYGLDCPTTGDAASINSTASGHVDTVVLTLKDMVPGCGNNTIDGSETCDGTDLAGETCVTQGYDDGDLACDAMCNSFNTSDCASHDCNLIDQTGCGMGEACYPLGQSELCAGEGSAIEGQACAFANSCVGGMACVDYGMGNVCAPFCDNIDNVPGCAVMQTCTNVPAWDGPNVGYCEP